MKFTDILTSSAHAFIIEGKGDSCKDFVTKFVKALNCEAEALDDRPCGECSSCRQIAAGTSLDVVYMQRSGKSIYTVKDASQFIERLSMSPYGRHVIGVIGNAENLPELVQNKLLKTLEEPAPGVVIVLATSSSDNMISTVKSRCNLIRVSEFTSDNYVESNEEINEIVKSISSKMNFYEYRDVIDKKIKSQNDAIELLGLLEDSYRNKIIEKNGYKYSENIELIEMTRRDIYLGMHFAKALKRLSLELI